MVCLSHSLTRILHKHQNGPAIKPPPRQHPSSHSRDVPHGYWHRELERRQWQNCLRSQNRRSTAGVRQLQPLLTRARLHLPPKLEEHAGALHGADVIQALANAASRQENAATAAGSTKQGLHTAQQAGLVDRHRQFTPTRTHSKHLSRDFSIATSTLASRARLRLWPSATSTSLTATGSQSWVRLPSSARPSRACDLPRPWLASKLGSATGRRWRRRSSCKGESTQ